MNTSLRHFTSTKRLTKENGKKSKSNPKINGGGPSFRKRQKLSASVNSYFVRRRKSHQDKEDDESSYHSAGQSDWFASAVMEMSDGDEDEEDEESGPLPEPPESTDGDVPTHIIEFNPQRQDSSNSNISSNKDADLLESAPLDGLGKSSRRIRQLLDIATSGEERSCVDSLLDDNSDAPSPRGSLYLKRLDLSPTARAVLGLMGTLLVVVPFAFAVNRSQNKSGTAKDELDNTNANTTNITRIYDEPPLLTETTTTPPPTMNILQRTLPDYTMQAATQQGTPQSYAYQWFLGDPLLDDYDDWEVHQRMAMATLYHSFATGFDDPHWLDYNVSDCQWLWPKETTPCHTNGTIARMQLDNLSEGSMPAEIGLLSHLEELHFSNASLPISDLINPNMAELTTLTSFECVDCQLYDEVEDVQEGEFVMPTVLGKSLANLQRLELSSSSLTGPLPSEVGLLTRLTSLNLRDNHMRSAIPSELGNLSRLNTLWLNGNNLIGEVPTSAWSQWTDIQDLDLYENNLSGSIPSMIGAMTALQQLNLGRNRFSGILPSEMAELTALTTLRLGRNNFGGTLPYLLRHLSNLGVLELTGNQLTGVIPWFRMVTYLSNLSELDLGQNSFTGVLSAFSISMMSNHTKLHVIDVSSNQLNGTIPSELGAISSLTSLLLNDNQLHGILPREFGQLTNLGSFSVENNVGLNQTVPQEMCAVAEFDNFIFGWCAGREQCCSR